MTSTVSVAESCTGGLLADALVSVSGASRYFEGGIVCYNIDQKCRHLGVDRNEAAKCSCVSKGVARQMARGCAILFGTRFASSTTGFAEPYRERPTDALQLPIAFVSVYDRDRDAYTDVQVEHDGLMDRNAFRRRIVDVAKSTLVANTSCIS